MSPMLLAALINQIAIPELMRWLAEMHQNGQTLDDAAMLAKLEADAKAGITKGEQWLREHPL